MSGEAASFVKDMTYNCMTKHNVSRSSENKTFTVAVKWAL